MSQGCQWRRWIVTLLFSGLLSVSSTSQVSQWDHEGIVTGGSSWQGGNWQGDWRWQDGGGWKHGMVKFPKTSFKCSHQLYMPGYYADVETYCKVFHVCHNGRMESIYCPPGTVFNQQILTCDYERSVDCESSPYFFYKNKVFGKVYTENPYTDHSIIYPTPQKHPSYPTPPKDHSYPTPPKYPSYPTLPQHPSYPIPPKHSGYPTPPKYPSYPIPPKHPSYPIPPKHSGYPTPPKHPSYPTLPQHPSYPIPPKHPDYPTLPKH